MNHSYKLLLSCVSLLMTIDSLSQSIIRGPYLQKGTPISVVVRWRTDSNTSSIIQYSTDTSYDSTSSDSTLKTDHELEITGLSPNTKYFYRIGLNGDLLGGSTDLYFKTHPTSETADLYRFWILGNTGEGNSNALNVRDAYYDDYSGSAETDGLLFLGDNAYNSGTDSEYQTAVFDIYDAKLKNTIAWSCLGNHEGYSSYSSSQTGPYYEIFTFPEDGESGGLGSGTESYYSFDYGNIHFIVLNSFDENRDDGINQGSTAGPMYTWAENDIQNTTQKWIIALWHHPPYSKGWYDSDTTTNREGEESGSNLIDMRENFLPMLEENGVDLVLTAHSLTYERSYFLNGHYGLSDTFDLSTHTIGDSGGGNGQIGSEGAYLKTINDESTGVGTVYVVTSTASQKVYIDPEETHGAMYYSASQFGSSILEVNGNDLTFKFLNEFGDIEDFFTIQKPTTTLWLNDKKLNELQIFTTANPNQLFVNGKLNDNSTLSLYDFQGRLVLSQKLNVNSNSNMIGVESVSSGVYVVKINIDGLTRTQKVIIR